MELWQYVATIFTAVIASGGFWTLIQSRMTRTDMRTKLLLGLAHDRIIHLAVMYINRGYITKDEFVNVQKYLAEPYFKLGGNSIVETIMKRVTTLPIKDDKEMFDILKDGKV